MMLGAGRQRSEDVVDPAVGLTVRARLGDHVAAGQPLAVLWHHPNQDTSKAEARLLAAYELRGDPVEAPRLVRDVLET
jgi:thymidine phosphorylase